MLFMGTGMVAGGATLGQSGGFSGVTGSLATAGGIGSGMITPRESLEIVDVQRTDTDFNNGHGGGAGYGYWHEEPNYFYQEYQSPPEIQKFRQRFGEDFVLDGNPGGGGFGLNMMA